MTPQPGNAVQLDVTVCVSREDESYDMQARVRVKNIVSAAVQ